MSLPNFWNVLQETNISQKNNEDYTQANGYQDKTIPIENQVPNPGSSYHVMN